MDLSDATSIVTAVRNGLLIILGGGAALAFMMAFVRYFTGGADDKARGTLIQRLMHIGGSVVSIGLVVVIATPIANAVMTNGISQEIKSTAASGNSWLPKMDVDGESINLDLDTSKFGTEVTLGNTLRRVGEYKLKDLIENEPDKGMQYDSMTPTLRLEYEKAARMAWFEKYPDMAATNKGPEYWPDSGDLIDTSVFPNQKRDNMLSVLSLESWQQDRSAWSEKVKNEGSKYGITA